MNFIRQVRLLIFFSLFWLALYSSDTLSRGKVYLYTHDASLEWANKKSSQGYYMHEFRDALKRLGYTPIWTNKLDGLKDFDKLVILSSVGLDVGNCIKKYSKEKIIIFLWEPPTVREDNYNNNFYRFFSKIYTWDDSLVDNKQFFHFYYPEYSPIIGEIVPFREKKLCVMMNNNKDSSHKYSLYGERKKIIYFFENNYSEDFDLYGSGWNGLGLKNYKGYADSNKIDNHYWSVSKVDCINKYCFCYAYENMCNIKGYITEKILNVFSAGCVPIYWGAENITDYIPKNCFIDRRDFSSDEQLYKFLKNMKEKEYQIYINNIKFFLDSPAALIFSTERLYNILCKWENVVN
jgi:hypothetical protein